VKCAAFELPFTAAESYGRHDVQDVLGVLAESGLVHFSGEGAASSGEGQWQWTSESYPADAVSLRAISSDNFVVVDLTRGSDVIGETSFTSGPSTLHEKAIYIVEGTLYQVERLDFDARKAFVRAVDCDYYTDAITYTKVTVLETFAAGTTDVGRPAIPAHGEVHVASRVVGFKKIKFYTNENVGSGELDLPQQEMHTTAYWLTVPAAVMAEMPFAPDDRRDGIVGLAFALRQVAQLLLMCDRHDIGIAIGEGESPADQRWRSDDPSVEHALDEPRIFVYDNYPGGIGFSEPLYALHPDLLARTRELIASCACEHGCPTCVGPVGDTGPLAKAVALRVLDRLVAPMTSQTEVA
jgi:DEAD/DEAH box helicase domain-containing protein